MHAQLAWWQQRRHGGAYRAQRSGRYGEHGAGRHPRAHLTRPPATRAKQRLMPTWVKYGARNPPAAHGPPHATLHRLGQAAPCPVSRQPHALPPWPWPTSALHTRPHPCLRRPCARRQTLGRSCCRCPSPQGKRGAPSPPQSRWPATTSTSLHQPGNMSTRLRSGAGGEPALRAATQGGAGRRGLHACGPAPLQRGRRCGRTCDCVLVFFSVHSKLPLQIILLRPAAGASAA